MSVCLFVCMSAAARPNICLVVSHYITHVAQYSVCVAAGPCVCRSPRSRQLDSMSSLLLSAIARRIIDFSQLFGSICDKDLDLLMHSVGILTQAKSDLVPSRWLHKFLAIFTGTRLIGNKKFICIYISCKMSTN